MRKAGLSHNQISCFVLCGYYGDTPQEAEERCRLVFDAGGIPFISFFQPFDVKARIVPREWKDVIKEWSYPRVISAREERRRKGSTQVEKQDTLFD